MPPFQRPLWILKQFFALISNSALLAGKLEVFSTDKRSYQTKAKKNISRILLFGLNFVFISIYIYFSKSSISVYAKWIRDSSIFSSSKPNHGSRLFVDLPIFMFCEPKIVLKFNETISCLQFVKTGKKNVNQQTIGCPRFGLI